MLGWLSEGQSVPVIQDVFHFTLVFNTGIAFGLFQEHGAALLILISASLVVLFFVCRWMTRQGALAAVSMALIFGGAIGNWIDRIRVRAVIDYLDFRVFPVFNFADSAITLGVILYFWMAFGLPGSSPRISPDSSEDKPSSRGF